MNVKFAILSTIAIIAASSTVQSAEAQGARFKYAPNVFKMEESRLPPGYGQPAPSNHSVTHGSMPKGTSLLGFDPKMLAPRPQQIARGPRVAPIAQTQLSGIPSFTTAVPMLNPFAPVANKGQFGQPLGSSPVVASLPPQASKPQGQAVQQKSFAPTSAGSNLSGRINPRRSNTAVAGRLAPRARGLAAKPGSPIQSYGNNNFYQSGPTAPTGSSVTTSATGNVYGRVLYKSTKH